MEIVEFVALRGELAAIATPADALLVREKADRLRKAYSLMNRSVGECNKFAEIYLAATWRFGDLVKDNPEGAPIGNSYASKGEKQLDIDDQLFSGTSQQRKYARKVRHIAKETDIPDYVREATAKNDQASIAGLLEWLDPGRHGNLRGEYEWYTPPAIIDAAREVLGEIDLDPASSAVANRIVGAVRFYTEEENGLEQCWDGRIFLNPPFAHPTVKYFAEKLIAAFEGGEVEQAIWLSNACVDVSWWQDLAMMGPVCLHRGRIKFYGLDEKLQPPTVGQSIIYLGDNLEGFARQFAQFGVVMRCHSATEKQRSRVRSVKGLSIAT